MAVKQTFDIGATLAPSDTEISFNFSWQ